MELNPDRFRPSPAGAMISLGIVSLIWLGFGVFGFYLGVSGERRHERRVAAIGRGEVPAVVLTVTRVARAEDVQWPQTWTLGLTDERGRPVYGQSTTLPDVAATLRPGSRLDGYRFGTDLLVPALGWGGRGGKWIFLGFGFLPLPVWAAGLVVSRRRQVAGRPARERVAGATAAVERVEPAEPVEREPSNRLEYEPRHRPKAVRLLRATTAASAVPVAFSADVIVFDHDPADAELVALLGDSDHSSRIQFNETPRMLTARYGTIPMKFVVPWMVLVVGAATVIPLFVKSTREPFYYGMIALAWLVILPTMFGIVTFINGIIDAKPDLFRIDKVVLMLEVPQSGLRVGRGGILAFVDLKRWHRHLEGTAPVRQAGVLVRADAVGGAAGEVQYHPVLRVTATPLFRQPTADRLADLFGAPVRRVKLSMGESRRLRDSRRG